MDHLVILYHFFLTVLGAVVTGFLVYTAKRSGQKRDWFLLLFFSFFFLNIFLPVINRYLKLNLYEIYAGYFEVIVNVNLFARVVLLISLLFFAHTLISFRKAQVVLWGLAGAVIVAFIARVSLFKTVLLESSQIKYHPVDLMDFISLIIVLYGLGNILFLLKIIKEQNWKMLLKRIFIVTLILLPGIIADTWHIYPIQIHFSSLLFLGVSLILIFFINDSLKSPGLQNQQVLQPVGDLHELSLDVSEREQEIIHLVRLGLSNKDIAQKLFISLSTVKSHLYNIYKKAGVKNRYELIRKSDTSEPSNIPFNPLP